MIGVVEVVETLEAIKVSETIGDTEVIEVLADKPKIDALRAYNAIQLVETNAYS